MFSYTIFPSKLHIEKIFVAFDSFWCWKFDKDDKATHKQIMLTIKNLKGGGKLLPKFC
jgi:hypothetical protein